MQIMAHFSTYIPLFSAGVIVYPRPQPHDGLANLCKFKSLQVDASSEKKFAFVPAVTAVEY